MKGELRYLGLLAMVPSSFLFFTAIGSITFFFSAMFNNHGRAIFASLGPVFISYVLDIFAKLYYAVSHINLLSIFYCWDPNRYPHGAYFAWGDLMVLAGISVLTRAAAVVWFERCDIAVYNVTAG
ncbi:MAG: hypothetical protein ACYCXF_00845 [Thermoleophilia bacterium]